MSDVGKPAGDAPVAGILLAAGASTRMGTPKQLLHVEGESLLKRVLREVLASDLDFVVLVLGHATTRVRASLGNLLQHPKLRVTENPAYREGLSTSLIRGLEVIPEGHDHIMILLADMPHTDRHVINRLRREFLHCGLPLGAAALGGKRTHPVMISRPLFGELRTLKGDTGAKSLFLQHPCEVFLMEVGEDYDDRDLDTPEDYARLTGRRLEAPGKFQTDLSSGPRKKP